MCGGVSSDGSQLRTFECSERGHGVKMEVSDLQTCRCTPTIVTVGSAEQQIKATLGSLRIQRCLVSCLNKQEKKNPIPGGDNCNFQQLCQGKAQTLKMTFLNYTAKTTAPEPPLNFSGTFAALLPSSTGRLAARPKMTLQDLRLGSCLCATLENAGKEIGNRRIKMRHNISVQFVPAGTGIYGRKSVHTGIH